MKGRVKMYSDEKGYGFILGEDNKDYFFHVSEVKAVELVRQGQIVEFTPTDGRRGAVAKEIYPKSTTTGIKQFILFGDVRIKISNIKNYGIASDIVTVQERKTRGTLEKIFLGVIGFIDNPYYLSDLANETIDVQVKKKYLYVTTYQNDNYQFWEHKVDFDIIKKCKELDEVLT